MSPEQLRTRLETLKSGTVATITDLTGTEDHYAAVIVSPIFEGKSMIEQHRIVMEFLKAEIDSGEVHALTMKTYTPEQYGRIHGNK
ncbi:MAG: BolA family transcriptional regulator [Xanthomonadaceae bacterium]|nr:BolA family transcriptional regulator [Xanthomonadaceae bacterium]